MIPFNETQYLFNYEFEFLKRGFLGEILRLTFAEVNTQTIYYFSQFFLRLKLNLLLHHPAFLPISHNTFELNFNCCFSVIILS